MANLARQPMNLTRTGKARYGQRWLFFNMAFDPGRWIWTEYLHHDEGPASR